MKKLWITLSLAVLLAGCGGQQTMETVNDTPQTQVIAPMKQVQLQLPGNLSAPTLQNEETGSLYLCDDYFVTVHTVKAGDLQKTVQDATGMEKSQLQIVQTQRDGNLCYRWVWTTMGETGAQVGHGCILDDGAYHYVVTAMADAEKAGKLQSVWQEIFRSFTLTDPVSSGA